MRSYPHAVDDGAGERITFLGVRRRHHGDVLDVRNVVAPGAGPPIHAEHRR